MSFDEELINRIKLTTINKNLKITKPGEEEKGYALLSMLPLYSAKEIESKTFVADMKLCNCAWVKEIPYHGIFLGCRKEVLFFKPDEVKQLEFSRIQADFGVLSIYKKRLIRELVTEKDKKFKDLHLACGNFATKGYFEGVREINILEGTPHDRDWETNSLISRFL